MNWDGEERRKQAQHCQQEINEKLERVESKLNKINAFIFGDDDPSKGFVVRVDRLERVTHVVVWAGAIMVVGSLGFSGWMVQQTFSRVFR